IFSYLYLWTTAAAWLVCIGIVWFCLRPEEKWKLLAMLTTIGVITALALAPYLYLVSHRAATLDEQQTLALTHRPDLFRIPEIIGALILILIVVGVTHRKIESNAAPTILAASLGLLPFVVFNQQILTGRSMQPFHFAAFAANYAVLIGLFITITLWWTQIPCRVLLWTAVLSFAWGIVEVGLPSRLTTVPAAVMNDQIVPVLLRLNQLAKQDGTLADLRAKGSATTIVFSPQLVVSVLLPTWTSQGTLLDIGGLDFSSVS